MFGSQKKKKNKLNMEILMKINGMAILGKDTDEAKLIAPKRGEKSRKKNEKEHNSKPKNFFLCRYDIIYSQDRKVRVLQEFTCCNIK